MSQAQPGHRPPMSRSGLVLRYAGFAVVATLANLGTQRLALAGSAALPVAIGCGTLVGLVVKYLLDKRWIFFDTSAGAAMHGRKFAAYAATGVVTTLIFWGSETLFWMLWHRDVLREVGAVLGLAIGYAMKYRLDARLVFAGGSVRAAMPAAPGPSRRP